MVSTGTNIKVVDFGAARLLKAEQTEIGIIGSPLYMSPEQIMREPLTYHSDMFALGVVLYELFTGRRPFAGASVLELFDAIRRHDPVAPSTLRAGISTDVDRILARMLAKSVDERYPTWADLALDLATPAGCARASGESRPREIRRAAQERDPPAAGRRGNLGDGPRRRVEARAGGRANRRRR
jgi:serine/threonine-protein kinase